MSSPRACRKVFAMPPPTTSLSALPTRLPSTASLVETLAPPTMAASGRSGASSARDSASSSARIAWPAQRGQQPRQRVGRGVGAVRDREGVVDIDIAEFGQRGGEAGVVRLLARVEAQVLQQRDPALRQAGDGRARRPADAVPGEADRRAAERRRQRPRQRRQRHRGVAPPPRPAEMREDRDARAPVPQRAEGGDGAFDPRRVRDGAAAHRRVEVEAQQHAPPGGIEVVEGPEGGHGGVPRGSRRAVSSTPPTRAQDGGAPAR